MLPWAKVPAKVAWHGEKASNINPSLRYVYRGQTLYKLVGLVDGGGSSFSVAQAKKGYTIQFICRDGYKPKIPSKWIVGKKTWIVARLKNGKPLPEGEGPYRDVGSFIKHFFGRESVKLLTRIQLVF